MRFWRFRASEREARDEDEAIAAEGLGGVAGAGEGFVGDELRDDAVDVAQHLRAAVGDGDAQGCGVAEHLLGGELEGVVVGVDAHEVDDVAERFGDRLPALHPIDLQCIGRDWFGA